MSTKFITNNETALSTTVTNLIHQSKSLDFLVGFFFFSGFSQIYKEVKDVPLRILVGMDADVDVSNRIREYLTYFPENQAMESNLVLQKKWFDQVVNVIGKTDSIDNSETQEAFKVFKQKLLDGTLEVRKTLEPNHSKMYLFCSSTADVVSGEDTGKVIVGSSNFSVQGFKARNEVNVYLQDDHDYQEARKIFDTLWQSSVILVDGSNKNEFLEMMETAYNGDPHRKVVLKEEDIHCVHSTGVKLHGFPDRVEMLDDGTCLIVDFKTKRKVEHVEDDFATCFQIIVYAYLMESLGYKVSGGEFRYIRLGRTVKCKYDDEMKEALDSELKLFKDAMLGGKFPCGTSNCTYCSFSDICSSSKEEEIWGGLI